MRHSRRTVAALCLAALTLAAAWGLFAAPGPASAAIPQSPRGWDRASVLQNAQRWVDLGVPYSQVSWFRGYRQDCSGFVSMAWNLHASYPTGMMSQIARPIPRAALQPGDILLNNSGAHNHVVLFAKWAYTDHSWYIGYEQLSSTNRPVRRLIPYPYFRQPELYRPYRFIGLPPKPPAPKPAPKPTVKPVSNPRPGNVMSRVSESAMFDVPPGARLAFVLVFLVSGSISWWLTGKLLP